MKALPGALTSVSASTRRPRLFRISYLAAVVVAMVGWLIALSWAALSLLGLFV
jgi:diacylglycerol kinase